MGRLRITYRGQEKYVLGFVGRPKRKKSLVRPRRKWYDNIKTDLQEVGWGMNWIDPARDRGRWLAFVNAVMSIRVP